MGKGKKAQNGTRILDRRWRNFTQMGLGISGHNDLKSKISDLRGKGGLRTQIPDLRFQRRWDIGAEGSLAAKRRKVHKLGTDDGRVSGGESECVRKWVSVRGAVCENDHSPSISPRPQPQFLRKTGGWARCATNWE
jgi:hypothetical protein